jgi:hypothetical protein
VSKKHLNTKKWVDPQDITVTDPAQKNFITKGNDNETQEEQGQAVQALIEEQWLIKNGLINATAKQKHLAIAELHQRQRAFNPDDPALWGAARIANKLVAGDFSGAVIAAEAGLVHRQNIVDYAVSKKQSAIASKPRSRAAGNMIIEAIEEYFEGNPSVTPVHLQEWLTNGCYAVDEMEDDIFTGRDGKEIKCSLAALSSRLQRLRKIHKN